MKIAVCDDDPFFLKLVSEELEQYYKSLDMCIEAFSSGTELIRAGGAAFCLSVYFSGY